MSWARSSPETCVLIFVFQESVEEELLGDVTDGEKCGQAEPLGSKYPHVLKSLQQGGNVGGRVETRVFVLAGILSPVLH